MEISLVCRAQRVVKENIHTIYFYYIKIAAYVSQWLKNNRKLDFFFRIAGHPVVLCFFFIFWYSLGAVSPGSGALLSKELRLLICVTPVIIPKQSAALINPFCRERGSCISWIRREKWHLPACFIPPACGGAESITAAPIPPEHPSEPGSSNQWVPKQYSFFPRLCMPVSFPLPLIFHWECCICFITINALLLDFLQCVLAAA